MQISRNNRKEIKVIHKAQPSNKELAAGQLNSTTIIIIIIISIYLKSDTSK